MEAHPLGVGIVGCGKISGAYIDGLARRDGVRIVRCADADAARAADAAARAGAAPATADELLADPAVDIVVNLTPPGAHAEVALRALASGKHVFGEKPLATSREDAARMADAARAADRRLACAPDTFLGAAWQRARSLIDAGAIGEPVAVAAAMLGPGPESWHPDPAFFYAPGGGPLLDMGPYYLSAIVALLGPVVAVSAVGRRTRPTRTVGSGPLAGTEVPVSVPTHVAAVLELAQGAVATLVTSFDCADPSASIEIRGSEGTLSLPDPNFHGGVVRVRPAGASGPGEAVDGTGAGEPYHRGDGVADLADAIAAGTAHRASAELAAHVLDAMLSILDAAEAGRRVELDTTCDRPAPIGGSA